MCQETGGKCFSVDIKDYSHISSDPNWTFILSDSTDVENIVAKHPLLAEGIDVLLIDSLHVRQHVEKEFVGWFPYLKEGAFIFFDDVDPFIYRRGQRKDNIVQEFEWENLQDFVIETFRANEEQLRLEIHYGSSGLALMEKTSPFGTRVKAINPITYRSRACRGKFLLLVRRIKNRIGCGV